MQSQRIKSADNQKSYLTDHQLGVIIKYANQWNIASKEDVSSMAEEILELREMLHIERKILEPIIEEDEEMPF